MNQQSMRKIVARIPEKKRKEISDAIRKCHTKEEAAAVVAKYASFIPKDKAKEIFDRVEKVESGNYDSLMAEADRIMASFKK